ncbi:hypothetical protein FGA82_19405 [Pseudomonas fluorescens]|uniref:hypothetical protein n=1 Tax=Pseudomonas fluorescens TaxID=294 RepID=UPI00113118F5|nr:hypothetical protein [Pseudomonas fluorescens]TMU76877.1 hypothetical protein FGA82_19405 [Pseudomonas fluorescens]
MRYSKGSGRPPTHLTLISSVDADSGSLVFADSEVGEHGVHYTSRAELLSLLNSLLRQRVPIAVGGMLPGPADEVDMLIASKALDGPYIELSWSGPGHWTLREKDATAGQWQLVADARSMANVSFDPLSLKFSRW